MRRSMDIERERQISRLDYLCIGLVEYSTATAFHSLDAQRIPSMTPHLGERGNNIRLRSCGRVVYGLNSGAAALLNFLLTTLR